MIAILKGMRLNEEKANTLSIEVKDVLSRCCDYQITNGLVMGTGETLEAAVKTLAFNFVKCDQIMSIFGWCNISIKEKDIPNDAVILTVHTFNDIYRHAGIYPDDFKGDRFVARELTVDLSGDIYNKEEAEQLDLPMGESENE